MLKKYRRKIFLSITLLLVFAFGYLAGDYLRPSIEKVEGVGNKTVNQPEEVDFNLFWDAWRAIETKYVDRNDLDRQNMVYGAISGLLKSLDDPYSVFMEPETSQQFMENIKGSFFGIGAEIGIRKGILTIISPLENSPAGKAGLQAGDNILKVDDTLTNDLTLDQAVQLIRGEKGQPVKLLVTRESWEEAREITIIRDKIEIPILSWDLLDESGEQNDQGEIAHIQLYHFTESSSSEFAKALQEISKTNARGIVLDLRNNPGGYLEVAVEIASWFLPKGEVVIKESFGNGEKDILYRSKGYQGLENFKTVILINQGSASASEIVAGALRDVKQIPIVGKQSFGKGSVQQLEKLKGGASIKITVAKWLTPAGVSISEEGIAPDEQVEITEEDIQNLKDPQLAKALEVLANQ